MNIILFSVAFCVFKHYWAQPQPEIFVVAEVFAFFKGGWHWCDHQGCLFPAPGEDSLLYAVQHWLL